MTFVSYPSDPEAGSNSTTLNFSVLENNTNIYNTYSALTITKLGSGETIAQYPYKLYIIIVPVVGVGIAVWIYTWKRR